MSDHTKIEWCDSTWNIVTGCDPVSAGCAHCCARALALRFPRTVGGDFTVRLHADRLDQPLHWRRPRRVFVCSMGDLFHEDVPDTFIAAIFGVMAACPQHTFLVLTKRAARMRKWCAHMNEQPAGRFGPFDRWPLPNVLLGVSAEDQAAADARIPDLLATPAARRFVSCEPLLGPVGLAPWMPSIGCAECGVARAMVDEDGCCAQCGVDVPAATQPGLDWVVAGSESGPGRRDATPRWFRSLRDQCVAAGVPFFLKQADANYRGEMAELDRRLTKLPLLDGRRWAEFPR